MRTTPRHLILFATVGLLAVPGTAAAADWAPTASVPAPPVTPGFTNFSVQEAYQDGGIATIAWLEADVNSQPLRTILHAGTRAPGGAYVEQLTIPSTPTNVPSGVELDVAPDGAAVLGITALSGINLNTAPLKFSSAYRPVGASGFDAPTLLAADAERDGFASQVRAAISNDGTAAVAVTHIEPGGAPEPAPKQADQQLDIAVHPAGPGAWGSPQRLSPVDQSASGLALAFDARGNLTTSFGVRFSEGAKATESDDNAYLAVRRRPVGTGIFSAIEDVSGATLHGSTTGGHLGVNAHGDAVISYQLVETKPVPALDTWAITRSGSGGAWTSPQRLTSLGGYPFDAAMAPNGRAWVTLVAQGQGSTDTCMDASSGPAGGALSAPRCIGAKGQSGHQADIAFFGNDAAFGLISSTPGTSTDQSIAVGRWNDGAALPEVAHDVDTPGQLFGAGTIQSDRNGSVVMAWTTENGVNRKATALDGGAPRIDGVQVPQAATAGQPVAVSAAAVDQWSPLGKNQPTWDFGDGSAPAVGATAAHTYASAGTYTVTFRAADLFDNAAQRTASITVGAAGGPGDLLAPTASLTLPKSKKKRGLRASFKTLHGKVFDPAPASAIRSVEVGVSRKAGKKYKVLKGKTFKTMGRTKAESTFVAAKVTGNTWSLKLPKLARGKYVVLIRATDAAGNRSPVSRTKLTLR